MELGIEKCAMLVMRSGQQLTEETEMPNQENRTLVEQETYKYLVMLETDSKKQAET